MNVTLTDFEISVLDKFIWTQTYENLNSLKVAMRNYIREQKDNIISSGKTTEPLFESFTNTSVDHIARFLLENDFFHDRDGQVFILTEKGTHLRQQGSLEKYIAWEKERNAVLIEEMHTIEKVGYLDREQPTATELAAQRMSNERKSYLVYYVLIIVALAAFYLIGKYHKFN